MRNWAKVINKWPWLIVAGTLVVVLSAAVYGFGVFGKLTGGRDVDASAESSKVAATVAAKFKGQDYQLIGLFTSDAATVDDNAYKQAVETRVKQIQAHAHVKTVADFYNTGRGSFISKNRRQTYVAIRLDGTKAQNTAVFRDLAAADAPTGLRLAYGGEVAVSAQINDQISHDLEFAEMISFPLLALLLFLVFRSLVATMAPLAIGGMSIVGAFALVRVLSNFTTMSVYSINVITIMGLGLAIDYSLFVISRFREEMAAGSAAPDAVAKTLATAGRTVLFSGLTVMLCLLSLMVFPLDFLHSMALGGSAAVLAAVALATTILPAALRLLGHRINRLSLGSRHKTARAVESGQWYRLARLVMRRPVVTLAAALAVLLALGSPFLSAKFSMPTDDIVPKNLSSRAVGDDLKHNFADSETVMNVVITAHPQLSAAAVDATRTYLDEIRSVAGVESVTDLEATVGTTAVTSAYAAQILRTDPDVAAARAAFVSGDVQLVKVYTDYAPQSRDAQNLVAALRNVAPVPGITTQIGGESAELVDLLSSLASKIPLAAVLIFVAITVLLLLMLGSVVIPVKALILNALSLSAAFGVLVWIFQDGHLAGALNLVALGNIDAMQPVLIFAIAFGLAMDYELFLVSRIKEAYDSGASNEEATAVGVEKTAGIITSAALLLVVVIGAFATSRVTIIEQVGVGLAAAVIIDATIVRLVLLPASMRLLGRWNWWAPAPLARLRDRLGFSDNINHIDREHLSTAFDRPVEVDGKTMNVNVQGSGDKSIVLLAGRGVTAPSYDFAPLIARLKDDRTVFTVDYFGSGLSDMTDTPRTSENIAREIHEALSKLGAKKYTLVAHSISGIYGLRYANLYPEEVTSFVGIDTATPQMDQYITPKLLEETSTPTTDSDRPHDVRDDIADVKGYEYSDREITIMQKLYDRNRGNDDKFESMKKLGRPDQREEKPYDAMRFPENIPTKFFLSSESVGLAPDWYEREHEKQLTLAPGSGVIVLEGGHFLHHSQAAAIARGIKD